MDRAYYSSLTRNMALIVIVVSFIPMLLVGGSILYQFRVSYNEKVHAHLETLVAKHKRDIDSFLNEKLADIRMLARTFSFEELSNESFLQDMLMRLQEEYGPVFVDLGVINPRGLQVAYAGPFKLGRALYSTADWYQKAMQSKYFISDVFLGLRGLPHFIVAVKEDWKGEPWIMRATIDFVAFNTLVESIRIGETGFAFILNRKGEFQTKPLVEVVPNKEPYIELLKDETKPKEDAVILEGSNGAGDKNIYVAAYLKNREWVLIYQQRVSDAFADLNRALEVTIAILVLGGLGIITTAFIVSKRLVGHIAKADQETQKINEQIVETGKLASIGELAAGIAHEINNPVAIMVEEAGWLEDLLEEEDFKQGGNLDEFKRALRQIKVQGKRCKDITFKLLSFARKTDPRVQEVHLNELIEEIIAVSAQRAKYTNVTIQTDFQRDLPVVQASPTELQQVFLNLINNALDAMEKKGGNIKITTGVKDQFLSIEVSDSGPGIPKANLERVFDPFFTTKPVGKGTGLGLSICYGIIKKMGGDIFVESTVDMGTSFDIRIPLGKEKGPEREMKAGNRSNAEVPSAPLPSFNGQVTAKGEGSNG